MSLIFEELTDIDFNFDYKKIADDVVNMSLDTENFEYEAQISITICDLEEIHRLNKEFRDVDRPTDVLSFPMIEYSAPGDFSVIDEGFDCVDPESGEVILGDIVLCIDKIRSQALEYNHSVKREYAFLIAHSMLHLMGYDHMSEEEAKIMETKQENILTALDITREKGE